MRHRRTIITLALATVAAAAAVAVAYPRFGRTWCLQWGATAEESASALASDELLDAPDILSTRVVTVEAPAAAIWPWLLQFGPGRGGAYTYDWVENLMGLNMHSADRILPQFQELAVGDAFPLGTKGPVMRVASIDPERSLVFRSDDGHWVWSFTLVEHDGRTRLMSRNRIASPDAGPVGRAFNTAVMEPGSLVMERKMLLGIKERAERTAEVATR